MLARLLPTVIVAVGVGAAVVATGPAASAVCDPTTDAAACATAEASSQNASTSQTAQKAIDGVAGGYPGDHTTEWATIGGKVGSWLAITWPEEQQVGSVVLNDRPNVDDQVTAATIEFADGTTIMVPTLPNSGEALQLDFLPRATDTLRFTIDAVRSGTYNIGLSELGVRGEQQVASFLGTSRTIADADGVARVLPRAVQTVEVVDGRRLLKIDVELAALAGRASTGASDFVIVDADGTRYEPVDGPDEGLGDHELEAGDEAAGAVYIEVPERSPGLLLAYGPASSGDVIATWTLNAP
jgi:hypothetical protein